MADEPNSNEDTMRTFTSVGLHASPVWSQRGRGPATRSSTDGSTLAVRPGFLQFAALLYIFSSPLDVVPIPIGSPVELTGLLFLSVWGVEVLRGSVRMPHAPRILVVLAALVVWSFATIFWSYAPSVSVSESTTTLFLAASAIAVSGSCRRG